MKIYGIDGKTILDAPITSQAVHEEELMKSDYVRLSWKSNAKISLGVGSYIMPFDDGLKYRLIEPYEPQQDSEDTFTYQPEFQHPLMWLSKVPFTYATKNTIGEDVVQQEWEYTGLTQNILKYAVDFINTTFGFTDKEKFVLTPLGNIDTNVSLTFSSTDVLSALSAIANGCTGNKCEWHLSWKDKALYFGQVLVNLQEEIPTLKVGDNIGRASITDTREGYYNVFYPQGSTRNMSVKAASGENVSTGIRLGLDKTKYPTGEIDTRTKENADEPKQTLALTFYDVYPHVDCYVYNVRKRTRYFLDDNNEKVVSSYNTDGTVKAYKTYTVWYMRLAYPITTQITGKTPVATTTEKLDGKTQTLHWYDYVVDDKQIIDGYNLCGSFSVNTNEGALGSTLVGQPNNSDGFELKFHKVAETIPENDANGDSGVSILAGDYEIVFVNQNDTIIPTNESEGLIPRGEKTPSVKGNIVILYNIAMGDEEVTAAQDELERKTLAEIAYRHSDLKNYTFNAYPNKWAVSNPHLYIGQRVVYDDGNGYSYTTRVLKLTTNLDYDICQEITVGNSTIKGSQTQLKEDVQGLINGTISVGSGLSYEQVLNICKNYVSTRYLSRTHDDTAAGHIEFRKGLTSDEIARFKEGLQADELAFFDKGVQFGNTFVPGLLGKGGKIDGGGNGELRSLKLWEWLEVPELRFNRVSVYTGIRWDTFGGGIIESVSPDENIETGTCKLKLEEGEFGAIAEGDLCMGIWHDTGGNATDNSDDNKGNFTFAGFKTVYFQITSVSGNQNETFTYMLRSSNEGGNGIHPFAGMHFAGRGNIKNTERQAFRYTTTEYSVALMNVSTWEFQPGNYFLITGNIEGFAMPAINSAGKEYTKVFHGHGTVLGNAYIYGKIDQFERAAYFCGVDQSRGGFLAPGEEEVCTVTVLNGYGLDVTDQFTLYSVTRNTGDAASDAMWNQTHTNVGNPFKIAFSDLGVDGIHKVEAVFTVTATDEATDEAAKSSELEYFS